MKKYKDGRYFIHYEGDKIHVFHITYSTDPKNYKDSPAQNQSRLRMEMVRILLTLGVAT
jgi:hypothetical protein